MIESLGPRIRGAFSFYAAKGADIAALGSMSSYLKKSLPVAAILAAWIVGSCSSSGVKSNTDAQVDLTHYKTYRWIGPDEAQTLRLDNPKIDYLSGISTIKRIPEQENVVRVQTESELGNRGYTQASVHQTPDFYVTYYLKAKDQDWVSSWSGSTPSIDNVPVVIFPGFDRAQARDFHDGIVYMTIYDAKSRQPAWTGKMDFTATSSPATESEVRAAVGQLLEGFKKSA